MATATNRDSKPQPAGGQREEWTIHEGECLAGWALLEDRSVDVVITDPPYEAECHTRHRLVARAGGKLEVEPLTFAPITEEQRTESARQMARLARGWMLVFCQVEAAMKWRAALEAGGALFKRTCKWIRPEDKPQYSGDLIWALAFCRSESPGGAGDCCYVFAIVRIMTAGSLQMRHVRKAIRPVLFVGLSWALLQRSAFAQLELCAGQPCPKTERADEPSVQGEERAAPPRAVLIDAIVLTPALEKANARLGIEQAVTAVLRNAGWDPVSITTDCKDLGCASAAAAAAKASYAILLTGRFVKQETYVADIGVSLWRDGTVVSSQNEPQEEARYRSSGRSGFMLCGPPSGICTTRLLSTKLQDYTTSLVDAENVRIRVRRRVAAAAALEPKPVGSPPAAPVAVEVHPAVPASPIAEATNHRRILGWSLVIGGGVLVGGGVALWAVNDKSADCHGVAGDAESCRGRLQTRPAAIVSGLVGLAAAGVGVAILRWGRNEGQVAFSADGRGLSVGGKF